MKRVLKWNLPVDDRSHEIGGGKVVHVACQSNFDVVQVWTEEYDPKAKGYSAKRMAKVYGTGHEIPHFHCHLGSVVAAGGGLVWHVYAEPELVAIEPKKIGAQP